ncbi:nuclear transport factor 2 family protein [Microbacterium pumilum]|uniref:SnoaL-like domain-containing protein n=1 Tax=Microbacterium pumilum TaxID=344165 RepID=A0ABN2S3M6_9MICO
MTVVDSQRAMDRYFNLMRQGIDFDACYQEDVTWLVADTGDVIQGAHAVRDYVVALHASLTDLRSTKLVVGEDSAYLEGDCAAQAPGTVGRDHYCVAYDVQDDLIVAIRCYGIGG